MNMKSKILSSYEKLKARKRFWSNGRDTQRASHHGSHLKTSKTSLILRTWFRTFLKDSKDRNPPKAAFHRVQESEFDQLNSPLPNERLKEARKAKFQWPSYLTLPNHLPLKWLTHLFQRKNKRCANSLQNEVDQSVKTPINHQPTYLKSPSLVTLSKTFLMKSLVSWELFQEKEGKRS